MYQKNIHSKIEARKIQLSWDPPKTNPGAVKSYHIQYQEKSKKVTARIDMETSNEDKNLLVTPLTPCTVYTLKVCARNANDKRSEYITLTLQTEADVPDKPQLQTIRALTATRARLTFVDSSLVKKMAAKYLQLLLSREY